MGASGDTSSLYAGDLYPAVRDCRLVCIPKRGTGAEKAGAAYGRADPLSPGGRTRRSCGTAAQGGCLLPSGGCGLQSGHGAERHEGRGSTQP